MAYSIASIALKTRSDTYHVTSYLADGPLENHDRMKLVLDEIREHSKYSKDFAWFCYGGSEEKLFGAEDVKYGAEEHFPAEASELRFALAFVRHDPRGNYGPDEVADRFWERWSDEPEEVAYRDSISALPLPPYNDVDEVMAFLNSRNFPTRSCEAYAMAVLEVHEAIQYHLRHKQGISSGK